MKLETLTSLEQFLTSERATFRGHELAWVSSILNEIQQEKAALVMKTRARPVDPPSAEDPPAA